MRTRAFQFCSFLKFLYQSRMNVALSLVVMLSTAGFPSASMLNRERPPTGNVWPNSNSRLIRCAGNMGFPASQQSSSTTAGSFGRAVLASRMSRTRFRPRPLRLTGPRQLQRRLPRCC